MVKWLTTSATTTTNTTHFVIGEIEDFEVLGLGEEVGQLVEGGQSVVREVDGLQLRNVFFDDLKKFDLVSFQRLLEVSSKFRQKGIFQIAGKRYLKPIF